MPTPISLVSVGGKVTASTTNALITAANAQGQSSVIPTSVAGTGVSVGTNGKVAFTGATAVSINNCFPSTSDNFRVIIEVSSASAPTTIAGVLRAAGVDSTAANYDIQVLQGTSGTVVAANGAGSSSWGLNAGVTGTIHDITMEIKKPGLAAPTYGTIVSTSLQNPVTAPGVALRGFVHRLSSAFDGLTFTATGGTMTGSVRIFAYNNN